MRSRKIPLTRAPALVLFVLVPVSCGLIFLSSRIHNSAQSFADALLLPFQRAGTAVSRFILGGAHSAGAILERESRGRQLEEQVRQLEAQLAARELSSNRQAEQLEQLSLMLEKSQKAASASQLLSSSNIIARPGVSAWNIAAGTSSLKHSCVIDRGRQDGIQTGSPVTSSGCLVGKVRSVGRRTSRVILVVDPAFRAGVRLLPGKSPEKTRPQPPIQGLLQGAGHARCSIQYVPRDTPVNTGDLVVTSGLDGQFPPGLLIGKVTLVRTRELYLQIEVRPGVDLGSLQSLFIHRPVMDNAAGTLGAK